MNLFFLAATATIPLEEPFDQSLPRVKAVGPAFRDWTILLGAILAVAVIVLLWTVASARARRRAARREERQERRRSLKRRASGEQPLPKVESSDGRRRRRRKHRPRNPTLAETGGLPPVRDDDQLPQIPPH